MQGFYFFLHFVADIIQHARPTQSVGSIGCHRVFVALDEQFRTTVYKYLIAVLPNVKDIIVLLMPHRLYPLCPPLALELIVLMHQIRVLFISNLPSRQIPFILLRLSTQIQAASM